MILKNGFVMTEDFQLKQLDLQILNGKIAAIGQRLTVNSEGEAVIDMTGSYILPGFIDTHMHGACGHNVSDPDFTEDHLAAITRYEATQGVTSVAMGSVSCQIKDLLNQYDLLANAAAKRDYSTYEQANRNGARLAAIHAEGPFLNPKRKGAMNEKNILAPDITALDQMIEHGQGLLKLITIAPEREGAPELISHAVSRGLTVSMGHTDATYEEARAGILAGATQSTHTFNAMRSYNHRDPGILGAVLTDPSICCEMICDHIHLHPATIQVIYGLKGADHINIISDSEYGTGIDTREFVINGQVRYVDGGIMRLADGTIAGSASSMLVGIKNLLDAGIPLEDVSKMASRNPARTLKLSDTLGSIAVGKTADLAVLDEHYNVSATFVEGHCVYQR